MQTVIYVDAGRLCEVLNDYASPNPGPGLVKLVVQDQDADGTDENKPTLRECRHCGFLCTPNSNKARTYYPLSQD